MSGDLLVIVPTRRRRKQLDRFLPAADATREAATDLLMVIDDDDAATYDGLALPPRASVARGQYACLSQKLNAHALMFADSYPVIGWLADDTLPETPGWDRLLLGALATPGIAYPRNGRREDIPEHAFISSEIITALGWFFEPSLRHYWTDNLLADLGRAAGCLRYVPDAVVEHLHYQVSGSGTARDRTYAEAEANGAADYAAYQQWRGARMAADIATVRAVTGQSATTTPGDAMAGKRREMFAAVTGFVTWIDGRLFPVKEGDVFPAGHPALKAGTHLFAPVAGTGDDGAGNDGEKDPPDPGKTGPAAVRAAAAAAAASAGAGA